MAKLDEDGDGDVTLDEWKAKMPDELREALRSLGPDAVLSSRTTAAALGKGAASGRGKVATRDDRGKVRNAARKNALRRALLRPQVRVEVAVPPLHRAWDP